MTQMALKRVMKTDLLTPPKPYANYSPLHRPCLCPSCTTCLGGGRHCPLRQAPPSASPAPPYQSRREWDGNRIWYLWWSALLCFNQRHTFGPQSRWSLDPLSTSGNHWARSCRGQWSCARPSSRPLNIDQSDMTWIRGNYWPDSPSHVHHLVLQPMFLPTILLDLRVDIFHQSVPLHQHVRESRAGEDPHHL